MDKSLRVSGGLKVRVSISTWIFVAIYFTFLCAFAIKPNTWLQFGWMICTVVALVWCAILIILGAVKWREQAIGNLLSCFVIIVTVPVAFSCGDRINNAVFSYNLDRWNQAVEWVMAHNTPNRPGWIHLPPQYSDLADEVSYSDDRICGPMVDFYWGDGWPMKHVVRRYAINPKWADLAQCREDWDSRSTLTRNWYEISE